MLKDHDKIIIWLDYFNSELSRSQGRRVPINKSIKKPQLSELVAAAKKNGYDVVENSAYHPKRTNTESGYISFPKTDTKSSYVKKLSATISIVRGENRTK